MNNGTTIRELSSVGSERLPYKQRVGGSIPSVPTSKETTFVYQTKVVSLQLNPPFRVE